MTLAEFAQIVAPIAAAAAALASWRNVSIVSANRKGELHSRRPYLAIESTSVAEQQSPRGDPHVVTWVFKNAGARPACQVSLRLAFIKQHLQDDRPQFDDWQLANELAGAAIFRFSIRGFGLGTSDEPQFVAVLAEYHDPLMDQVLRQAFYLKWEGMQNKKIDGITFRAPVEELWDVSIEEKEQIRGYLRRTDAAFAADLDPAPPSRLAHRLLRRVIPRRSPRTIAATLPPKQPERVEDHIPDRREGSRRSQSADE